MQITISTPSVKQVLLIVGAALLIFVLARPQAIRTLRWTPRSNAAVYCPRRMDCQRRRVVLSKQATAPPDRRTPVEGSGVLEVLDVSPLTVRVKLSKYALLPGMGVNVPISIVR